MNRGVSFCAGFCIIFLLAFLTILIVSFSYPNSHLGGLFASRQRNLTIGLVFPCENPLKSTPNKDGNILTFNDRMLNITRAAINDINSIVTNERLRIPFTLPTVDNKKSVFQ